MPNQTTALALTPPAEALHEPEYQALVSALSESARGRAFLAEHARRTRGAETSGLLAALDRIEALVRAQSTQAPAHPPRMEFQALLDDQRAARPMAEESPLPAKAAQLAALLDLLTSRLADVLASGSDAIEVTDSALAQAAVPHAGEPARARWTDAPPDALVLEADALLSELRPPSSGSADRSEAFAFIMALSEEERIALFT
jgi:hypothetical protein